VSTAAGIHDFRESVCMIFRSHRGAPGYVSYGIDIATKSLSRIIVESLDLEPIVSVLGEKPSFRNPVLAVCPPQVFSNATIVFEPLVVRRIAQFSGDFQQGLIGGTGSEHLDLFYLAAHIV